MQIALDYGMIAFVIMITETVLLSALIIGWLYGARRMDLKLHHRVVYPVVLVHFLTVGLWMIPIALGRVSIMLADPIGNLYQIIHDTLGILGIGLGIVLTIMFAFKRDMPIKLLKKARPLMFLTIGVWILAFILGAYWYLVGHVLV
ncbi:MAG: hypothetical protein ACFFEF_02525 [Candidatus Thorarchaeota archaeon]